MDLKPLIALLAIVNPIGAVPFFISFTHGFGREERRRTMRVSAFSAFVVIAVSALAGLQIIEFFGISIASFQVGGGTLVLYGVVVGAAVYLAFAASERIARVLGRTGINVMTRLMGLILAAMAVEIMADGLTKLFPVLATGLPR